MLFGKGYRKKEDIIVVLYLNMTNSGFDFANFIIDDNTKFCKQMTWTANEEEKNVHYRYRR